MDYKSIPLVVIAGPTAVGKTELSIEIAKKYNGEVINGDSLQVYRHLNIGTGKVTLAEQQGIPHHLLDILEPHEQYDASLFKKMATEKVLSIFQRGKLPILVGGTGLYLEGLLYDLEFGGKNSRNARVRAQLEQRALNEEAQSLWEELYQLDVEAAKKIPIQNTRRVIRALEVIEVTGERYSNQFTHEQQVSTFDALIFILNRPRAELYERINQRVEQMVAMGLEDEVNTLYQRYNGELVNGMKGIGYKEWWPYFQGEVTKEEVIQTIQQNSRRYAKRQLTWFRNRMGKTYWVNASNKDDNYQKLIKEHLEKGRKLYD